jgi:hypothetical protein
MSDLFDVFQPVGQIPLPDEFNQEFRGKHKIICRIIEQGEEGGTPRKQKTE